MSPSKLKRVAPLGEEVAPKQKKVVSRKPKEDSEIEELELDEDDGGIEYQEKVKKVMKKTKKDEEEESDPDYGGNEDEGEEDDEEEEDEEEEEVEDEEEDNEEDVESLEEGLRKIANKRTPLHMVGKQAMIRHEQDALKKKAVRKPAKVVRKMPAPKPKAKVVRIAKNPAVPVPASSEQVEVDLSPNDKKKTKNIKGVSVHIGNDIYVKTMKYYDSYYVQIRSYENGKANPRRGINLAIGTLPILKKAIDMAYEDYINSPEI